MVVFDASPAGGWRSARMRRPSSTLLPSRRTTSGLGPPRRRALSSAPTMPLATASQEVMPPKTLTKTRLDLRVAEDDVQAVGHDLGRGAATDVEEVGRLGPAELLTGVGDDVEGAHDEARAVADDADGAVELDVVEVLLLGGGLERVGCGLVLEGLVVRVAEVGVLVERDLAVEGDDVAVLGLDERVDLDERRVLLAVDGPQLLQDGGDLGAGLVVEAGGVDDLARPWPSSMPMLGSTATRARASGRSTASCSISMPPSLEHMAR